MLRFIYHLNPFTNQLHRVLTNSRHFALTLNLSKFYPITKKKYLTNSVELNFNSQILSVIFSRLSMWELKSPANFIIYFFLFLLDGRWSHPCAWYIWMKCCFNQLHSQLWPFKYIQIQYLQSGLNCNLNWELNYG